MSHCVQLFSEPPVLHNAQNNTQSLTPKDPNFVSPFTSGNNRDLCLSTGTRRPIVRGGEQKRQCEPPTVFTSSARLYVLSLRESSYSVGRGGGRDRPCWVDLIPPGPDNR